MLNPTSNFPVHEAPAALNLTLVASGGLPTPNHPHTDTGRLYIPGARHGEYAGYRTDGCRCTDCTDANSTYQTRRTRNIAYGRWQPWADAAPIRAHAQTLIRQGVAYRSTANPDRALPALTGVPRHVIRQLLYGNGTHRQPSERIRPHYAQAILALRATADTINPAAILDGTGTRRRIQAMRAVGFPILWQARRLDTSRTPLREVLGGAQVTARRALEVRELYAELWDADPVRLGVLWDDAAAARHAAAERGWAPPLAWDEDGEHGIDNPEGWPDWTGICGQPGGAHAHITAGSRPCERCLLVPFGLECGTRRGYDQHRELGTETCGPCRTAVRTAAQARKARRRARQEQAA